MYVTYRIIQEAADKFGYPPVIRMTAPVDIGEFEFIRSTQHFGRSHDVTMFIFKGQQLIVIAKHQYPPGLFRPPSGACHPGESLEDGALRESYEETGCKIELNRYILQINVDFTCGSKTIPWKSHIFTGHYISGEIHPIDTREIRDVALASIEDFELYKEIIRYKTASGGLNYRARLHDEVLKLL
ncbi:MAG: NUDIX hydrolase [candidate division Zixibacteria bacterium]|nr:NUDIX hydrolase [candidate division Zixibacteria bacterium]